MVSTDELWSLLYDEYLPFSLYSDHRNGSSFKQLSERTGLPVTWVKERILAAEACINSGAKLSPPAFDRRIQDSASPDYDRRRHSQRDAA